MLWRTIGLLASLASVACFALAGPLFRPVIALAQEYLSRDQEISGIGYVQQILIVTGVLVLITGVSTAIWPVPAGRAVSRLRRLHCDVTRGVFASLLLWGSTAAGLALVALSFLAEAGILRSLHGEDGLLEMLTALLFLAAGITLLYALAKRRRQPAPRSKLAAALLAAIAIAFIFAGLEEISYGQRIFGWRTPAALARLNDQGEFNVHNLSNAVLSQLYRWGTLAFVLATALGWLALAARPHASLLGVLTPHSTLVGILTLMLLFGTYWTRTELLEELGAIFALSYSLAVLAARHQRRSQSPDPRASSWISRSASGN